MGAGPFPVDDLLVEVYREQRPRLWAFLLRGASDRQAAEDLLQEVFLRLWDHRDRLRSELEAADEDGMRRYLWRVARNLMIDEIRYRQRQRERQAAAPLHPDGVASSSKPGPAETLEHEDCLRVVRETASRVANRRARSCLRLWLDGATLPDIARELGLAAGQVRGLLQRARAEVVFRASGRLRSMRSAPGHPAGGT